MLSLFIFLLFLIGARAEPGSHLLQSNTGAQTPKLSLTDGTRLIEAFRVGDRLGDRIWPGWSRAPFAVLLVTPEYEFLIRHPLPSLIVLDQLVDYSNSSASLQH